MQMEFKDEASKIQKLYKDQEAQEKVNFLISGPAGSGKTTVAETCRRPVLIHSFDPGGTRCLIDKGGKTLIDGASILADTRFENEDPLRPTVFNLWMNEFNRLSRIGFFNGLGTYFLDSATNWSEAYMNELLKLDGRAGGVPQQQDYLKQIIKVRDAVKTMTTLPCDFVFTAHHEVQKDELTGRTRAELLITGKLRQKIPPMFDEIYVTQAKGTAAGVEYSFLTRNDGFYEARTRMGRHTFEKYEKKDIKHLLRKAGKPCEDKELFSK